MMRIGRRRRDAHDASPIALSGSRAGRAHGRTEERVTSRLAGWLRPRALFPGVPPQHRAFLPPGRLSGPMPWVVAIVAMLALLASAAGIGLVRAAASIGDAVDGRVTVQIVTPDPTVRAAQAQAVARVADSVAGVTATRVVPPSELAAMLARWFGEPVPGGTSATTAAAAALPMPALVDIDLAPDDAARGRLARAVAGVAPGAVILPHADWLGPVAGLARGLAVLAIAIVALMAGALCAVVMLTVRQALGVHEPTIVVLGLMGATDAQVARLFQRRLVRDIAFGVAVGTAAGVIVLALLGWQMSGIGAGLVDAATGAGGDGPGQGGAVGVTTGVAALLALPVATIALGAVAAQVTLGRALERRL